jgi:hypothetical protein
MTCHDNRLADPPPIHRLISTVPIGSLTQAEVASVKSIGVVGDREPAPHHEECDSLAVGWNAHLYCHILPRKF